MASKSNKFLPLAMLNILIIGILVSISELFCCNAVVLTMNVLLSYDLRKIQVCEQVVCGFTLCRRQVIFSVGW